MGYRRQVTVDLPYERAVTATREALLAQGFGVLSEIDMRATLRGKRGIEITPTLLLGACNPDLAARALAVEPGVAVLLPCTVVVAAAGAGATVQVLEPQLMAEVTGEPGLRPIADEAGRRLDAALQSLTDG